MLRIRIQKQALVLLFFFIGLALPAQKSMLPDTLQLKINNAKSDTQLVLAYRNAAIILSQIGDMKGLIAYADSGLQLARKILPQYTTEKALHRLYFHIAIIQGIRGTYMQMIGKRGLAIPAYLEAIELQEKYKWNNVLIANLNNVGILYYQNQEYDKAMLYYEKALKLNKNGEFQQWMSYTYHGMSTVFMDLKNYEKAEEYANKSVEINTKMNDKDGLANNYTVLADLRLKQNRKAEELEYLMKIKEIRENLGDPFNKATAMDALGSYYLRAGDNSKAIKLFEDGIQFSEANQLFEFISNFSQGLMHLYEKQGNTAKALYYAKMHITANDSVISFKNKEEVFKNAINFEYESKRNKDSIQMAEERVLNDLKIENKNQEIKHEKNIKTVIYIGLSLVILLLAFTFRSYLQKKKANEETERQKAIIEEKQTEILDSIRYAKRIQTALMSSERYMHRKLNELKNKK